MVFLISSLIWGSLSFARTFPCSATYGELEVVKQEVASEEEFFYCFGFHHGKDRAWVMDYFRRSAEGTNAEVHGLEHLKSDLMMRLLDLPGVAEKIWKTYPVEEKIKLEAYSDGVNAGFVEGKHAREFVDADYSPEAWMPVDTIEVLLLQSFDQTRKTFSSDVEQEKYKIRWKNRASTLMDNDHAPWENTILKAGEYPHHHKKSVQTKGPDIFKTLPALWSPFPEIFGTESGSNNWAIAKSKSKSGVAMLANDPHLDLKTPLFWYWIHLRSPEQELIGASLPGVPLVASGTNGHVAWGLTNAYINTADAVFVKDIPSSEIVSIRPLVWFKFWKFKVPFFFKSFEKTKRGHPVLPIEMETDEKIFLRWTGFNLKATDVFPMFSLAKMKNAIEMNEKLKEVGLPSWNFVFADTEGKIGYRLIGNAYRASEATPFGMKSMSYDELSKENYFSPDERPHVFNPARGYVYSANNRHWPVDSATNGGRGYTFSFRGNRIDELLQSQQDVESFKRIQCDHQAVDAKYFVPLITQVKEVPELVGWNYQATEELVAPGIYRRLMDHLMTKLDVNEYGLYRLLESHDGSVKGVMADAYEQAKSDVGNRTWGEIHRLGFAHLSKNPAWNFAPEISAPGDNHTVDPGTAKWNEERKLYEHSSGASMRMIIEMQKRPVIHLVQPGFNRDYVTPRKENPWRDWKECKYSLVSF